MKAGLPNVKNSNSTGSEMEVLIFETYRPMLNWVNCLTRDLQSVPCPMPHSTTRFVVAAAGSPFWLIVLPAFSKRLIPTYHLPKSAVVYPDLEYDWFPIGI